MAETTKRQQSGNRKPGRPKGSTSKKTSTSAKSRGTTGKKAYEQDNTEFMRAEVVIICSFAVAILLFLSNFKLCGVVGDVLRGVQLGDIADTVKLLLACTVINLIMCMLHSE